MHHRIISNKVSCANKDNALNFFSFYQDKLQNEAMIIGYPVIDLGYRPKILPDVKTPSRYKDIGHGETGTKIEEHGLHILHRYNTISRPVESSV